MAVRFTRAVRILAFCFVS